MRRLVLIVLSLLLLAGCGRDGAGESPAPTATPAAPFWETVRVIPDQVRFDAEVLDGYPQVYTTRDEGLILQLITAMDMESWQVDDPAGEDGLAISLTYNWGERIDLRLDGDRVTVHRGAEILGARMGEGTADAVGKALDDIAAAVRAEGLQLSAAALSAADGAEVTLENQMEAVPGPGEDLRYDTGAAATVTDGGVLLRLQALLNPGNWAPEEPEGLTDPRSLRLKLLDDGQVLATLDVFGDDILRSVTTEASENGDYFVLPEGTYDAVLELLTDEIEINIDAVTKTIYTWREVYKPHELKENQITCRVNTRPS